MTLHLHTYLFAFFCTLTLVLPSVAQIDSTRMEMVIVEQPDSANVTDTILATPVDSGGLIDSTSLVRPTKSLAQLQAEYNAVSVSKAAAQSLEPSELESRYAVLKDIRAHLRLHIRWREAYGATKEDLQAEQNLMDQVRISMAYAELHAREERQRRADDAIKNLLKTKSEQMYDAQTLKLNNPEIINTLKENIFYSSRRPDFQSVALGTVLANCKEFGLDPQTRAIGYRLGIGDHTDKYNLLILKLHTGEIKAFLWDDVYGKIVDMM